MTWDLSKLGKCEVHGHHAGSVCPLCDSAVPPLSPGGGATFTAPCGHLDHAMPPTEEYDRTNWHKGPEKELHDWLEADLLRRGISYVHARTDQKSTISNGWPDFSCFFTAPDGITRACFVELKNRAGRTSVDQRDCIAELQRKNIPVLVTGDFRQAVEFIKLHLCCE
jgi:hypothetical protein